MPNRKEFAFQVYGEQMLEQLDETQKLLDVLASKLSDHEIMDEANAAADRAMEVRTLISDVKKSYNSA